MRIHANAVLLALASAPAVLAQTPSPLFDVNQQPIDTLSSSPREFVRLGNRVLFTATTPALGTELWALDLSTRITTLVVDLAVGTASSSPGALTAFAGHVYFAADDGVHGQQLWRTDGTAAGTIRPDLVPGGGAPSEFAVANGKLFCNSNSGLELVVTDGTAAGTQVLDIPGGNSQPRDLVRIGNEVWFSANTPAFGTELWRTDGTQAGTSLVFDANPGPAHAFPRRPIQLGSERLFAANDRLWRTDGTPAGTSELASPVREVAAAGSLAFFLSGAGLWRTDGTAANTQLVTTVPLPPFGFLSTLSGFDTGLTFLAEPGLGGGASMRWVSNGTAAGTFALGTTTTAPTGVHDGNHFYFAHATSGAGRELWRTDGTQSGTTLVADVVPGPVSSSPLTIFAVASGDLLFSAATQLGRELWGSDGTAAGTALIANLADETGSSQGSNARGFVDAGGFTYFAAFDGAVDVLWRTDGTAAGTAMVVPPGPDQPNNIGEIEAVGTKVFFVANTPTTGYELWVSDGTAGGTQLVDIWAGPNSSTPIALTAAADLLYFTAFNPVGGRSLWRTDGTLQGTVAVSYFAAGAGTLGPMAPFGRGLLFAFQPFSSGLGQEPWFTDGTVAGTVPLGDLSPGPAGSMPQQFAALGDRCYFTARRPDGSNRLMVTDGTAAGTIDLLAGATGKPTDCKNLRVVRDRLFLLGYTAALGQELWVSDGSAAGTVPVLDAVPGNGGIAINEPTPFGDLLLYRVENNGADGLWRSDGTAAGTFRLCTTIATRIVATGERAAWFRAGELASGAELWRTDGTAAGTALHTDLLPGDRSSYPDDFVLSRGKLLFGAEHAQLGREAWILDLPATSQEVGFGCTPTTAFAPRLWSGDPVLGGTTALHVHDGPALGISIALFSNHTTTVHPLGSGLCSYFVDANLLVLGFELIIDGVATHLLPIPNQPSLDDQLFRMQAITLPATGLLGAELSNALTLALGS